MGSKIKISVIVPIYNVDKYLEKCIASIIDQNLKEIEILLLNDGSTDNSLDICYKYAKIDSRIKVFTHNNRGLGPTRNRGISLAQGDYLAFVDSDDYITIDGLEKLYNKAIDINADVVEAETMLFNDNDENGARLRLSLRGVEDISIEAANAKHFYSDYYFSRLYTHNACDKIYKRSFIINNNVLFGDNKVIFAEDNWFQLQLMRKKPIVGFLPIVYYWYRQQDKSIMHQPKKRLIERHGQMIIDYQNLIADSSQKEIEDQVCSIVAADVFTLEALNANLGKRNHRDLLSAFKRIRNNSVLCESICDLNRKKSYQLYSSDWKRKTYLAVIGFLYSHRLYDLAHNIVWVLYKSR